MAHASYQAPREIKNQLKRWETGQMVMIGILFILLYVNYNFGGLFITSYLILHDNAIEKRNMIDLGVRIFKHKLGNKRGRRFRTYIKLHSDLKVWNYRSA